MSRVDSTNAKCSRNVEFHMCFFVRDQCFLES